MKTRLTIAMGVVTAALLLLVPSAAPKGKPPAGTPLSAVCAVDVKSTFGGTSESCSINGGGILANTTYIVSATDTCGNDLIGSNNYVADTAGNLNVIVSVLDGAAECTPIFTISTFGKRSQLVGTVMAQDLD